MSELRSKYFETPVNDVNQALDELSGQITLLPVDPFARKRPIIRQRSSPFPVPTFPLPSRPPTPSPLQFRVQQTLPLPLKPVVTRPLPRIHRAAPNNRAIPQPQYLRGRDRFPERKPTFHPSNILDLYRHDRLAGAFDEELFQHKWTEPGRLIDDRMIIQLAPEMEYPGIQYRVTVHSRVWTPNLRRGDHIILKGIDSSNIKYIATWTLNDFHNDQCVYVQFNAMNIEQQCVDATNPDWPTLGFLVPKDRCFVPTAPLPKPVEFRSDANGNFLQSSPTLSASSLTPLIHQRRRNSEESPIQKRLRYFASFNVLDCWKANAIDDVELEIKG